VSVGLHMIRCVYLVGENLGFAVIALFDKSELYLDSNSKPNVDRSQRVDLLLWDSGSILSGCRVYLINPYTRFRNAIKRYHLYCNRLMHCVEILPIPQYRTVGF
jgi:hypothetical protein